jgi:hypothetical protein
MYSTDQLLAVDRTGARQPGRAISRYSWIALAGPLLVGVLVGLGGGFSSTSGYYMALYAISALMLLGAVLATLFTRETTGWFRSRDRALV